MMMEVIEKKHFFLITTNSIYCTETN